MLKSWNESLWLLFGEICCSDFPSLKKKKKAKNQMVYFYEESSNCGSQGEC